MEKSNKRGKIPQQDWPSIMARYDSGETLASIARTYDCSPPAISYIVSRSRARGTGAEAPQPEPAAAANEPQLVKSHAEDSVKNESVTIIPSAVVPPRDATLRSAPGEEGQRHAPPRAPDSHPDAHPRNGNATAGRYGALDREAGHPPVLQNGAAVRAFTAAPAPGGDPRRTLHLSLTNGGPQPGEVPDAARPAGPEVAERAAGPGLGAPRSPGMSIRPPQDPYAASTSVPARPDRDAARSKDGGSFIDQALRARVDGDIAAFLAAFDAALAGDSQESRAGLREATDRLLRAGARTRIELERLEARMPLPPRDVVGRESPAWRHR